jgi:hypothetical protein
MMLMGEVVAAPGNSPSWSVVITDGRDIVAEWPAASQKDGEAQLAAAFLQLENLARQHCPRPEHCSLGLRQIAE